MKKCLLLFLTLALLLSGCAMEGALPSAQTEEIPGSQNPDTLYIHYIDVGQADCALIAYGAFYMLIDGGNREDSQLVVSYLEQQGVDSLTAVVCTHAHEDHVGGLAGVLAVYPVQEVYAPTATYASSCFDDFMYYVNQQDLTVTIPEPGRSIAAGDLQITFLGPVTSYADTNNTSLVLRLDFGETAFLFTGDMETAAETDLLDAGTNVAADVLKVGHHGSNTSTGYRFLYEVAPEYAVISVGEDNAYGHPHDEPLSRLTDAGCTILRTDRLGTIVAASDGQTISFTWENQIAQPESPQPGAEQVYIGNVNSHTFHAPDCPNLPSQRNQIRFSTYQEAIDAGYTPCGGCLG